MSAHSEMPASRPLHAERKLWRTAKPWVPHEWATKKEAWLRVYAALSENIELTRRDLKAHLLARRLVVAARVIVPDGSERCIIFKPAFWEPIELTFAYMMTGFEKYVSEGEAWHFFVRRRELDQLYPPATTATSGERQGEPPPAPPERRPPGPRPSKGWKDFVTRDVIKRLLAGKKFPTAPTMIKACIKELEIDPDDADMRRHLRWLRGE